jgi:hypothetical protein
MGYNEEDEKIRLREICVSHADVDSLSMLTRNVSLGPPRFCQADGCGTKLNHCNDTDFCFRCWKSGKATSLSMSQQEAEELDEWFKSLPSKRKSMFTLRELTDQEKADREREDDAQPIGEAFGVWNDKIEPSRKKLTKSKRSC